MEKMLRMMMRIWVHPVFEFVINDQGIRDEEQKDNHVQEKYIEKATIVDISGKFICLEEVCTYFSNQVDYVNDLISLGPQLFVGLHRKFMSIHSHL